MHTITIIINIYIKQAVVIRSKAVTHTYDCIHRCQNTINYYCIVSLPNVNEHFTNVIRNENYMFILYTFTFVQLIT